LSLEVPGEYSFRAPLEAALKKEEMMAAFSEDRDILKYEPEIFKQYYFQSQVLVEGTGGTLNGTSFTASGVDFIICGVSDGGVIYLEATGLIGCPYEIISVDSATELTVSILRAKTEDNPIALPSATGVSYRVSTFAPIAEDVGIDLIENLGICPSETEGEIGVNDILNQEVLRRASVFSVISRIYASLVSGVDDEHFWKKSGYYQKLFEKARERCRLDIDTNGDGNRDIALGRGTTRLVRD
jgi:hypothetical protein